MNSVLRNLAVWFVLGSLLIYVFNNHILIYDYVFLKYLKRKIIDEFIVS